MIRRNDTLGRTARRTTTVAATLLVTATGTVAAHGGNGGGMMGGWETFGGAMGLWGILWMGLLLAVPLLLVYALVGRDSRTHADEPFSTLRERYARGGLSDEEFERRRERLQQAGEGR